MGQVAGSTGDIAKLENQVATYKVRKGLYYILATQDGQITQLTKAGIGEIVKDAETIGIIVPKKIDYIAEIYVKPVDLPLIRENQKVMLTFDGFPAIVFFGWPNSSYGTFSGKIIAIENSISENGLFKAIVAEDKTQKMAPNMKIGTGASGIAILNDVPIWYEIWRNINGFPPDYYQVNTQKNEKNKILLLIFLFTSYHFFAQDSIALSYENYISWSKTIQLLKFLIGKKILLRIIF
jgi:hypothetical protein